MNNENQTTASETNGQHCSLGNRLQSAREAIRMSQREVADHLRLNERIISMIEKENYPSELPVTFIRGYIRAYGKFLQIPEQEIKLAISHLQPPPSQTVIHPIKKQEEPVWIAQYIMQFFTYAIILTLIGLAGAWWYTHNNNLPPTETASTPQHQSAQLSQDPTAIFNVTPLTFNGTRQMTANTSIDAPKLLPHTALPLLAPDQKPAIKNPSESKHHDTNIAMGEDNDPYI